MESNQKKLYEHFVKVGNKKNIDMMLKVYPHFADESTKTDVDFSSKNKTELKKLCDEAGLEYSSESTKDDLIVILENKSDEVK